MEFFNQVSEFSQLGFGSVVSVLLVWMVVKYLPAKEQTFQEALERQETRHREDMEAYRREHAEIETEAHKQIIEMYTKHDERVRALLGEVIHAILMINPDVSETEKLKIKRRLLGTED